MNIVVLHGRVGQKERKDINGTALCKLSVADTKKYKDKQGNRQERTNWFQVSYWGNAAETVDRYFNVGDPITITGEMESRQFEQDGKKITFWELKATGFDFPLSPAKDKGEAKQDVKQDTQPGHEAQTEPANDLPF